MFCVRLVYVLVTISSVCFVPPTLLFVHKHYLAEVLNIGPYELFIYFLFVRRPNDNIGNKAAKFIDLLDAHIAGVVNIVDPICFSRYLMNYF